MNIPSEDVQASLKDLSAKPSLQSIPTIEADREAVRAAILAK